MSVLTMFDNYPIGLSNVYYNGFADEITKEDQKENVPVTWKHFQPVNTWEKKAPTEDDKYKKHLVIDQTTGDAYLDESDTTLRLKCLALVFASIPLQMIGAAANNANRAYKILTFAHFRKEANLQESFYNSGEDVLKIALSLPAYICMEIAAIYGIVRPQDGRKIYASLERFVYSGGYQQKPYAGAKKTYIQNCLLAPCFQPRAKAHLGGGDLGTKDAW